MLIPQNEKQIFGILLIVAVVVTPATGQSIITIGSAEGANFDSTFCVALEIAHAESIAGVQFDLVDSWGAMKIDSVRTAERAEGFIAQSHHRRILMYHPQGEALAAGKGAILQLFLRLSSPQCGIDSLFFASPPIIASSHGDRIWPIVQQAGSITIHAAISSAATASLKTFTCKLLGNFPNPFNQTTIIAYELAQEQHVTLHIYDISGRKLATIVDGRQPIGRHCVTYRCDDLPSGVYVYRLNTAAMTKVGKMVLLR